MKGFLRVLKAVFVLVVSALLLLVLSFGLKSIKDKKTLEEQYFVFSYLLMDSTSFEEEPYSGEDGNIQRVFKGSNGYIVETRVAGYADDIVMWVGVKNDGYVTGLTVRDMDETIGLGRKALSDVGFLLQFLRNEGDASIGDNMDAISGATVTSKAIAKAINSSVAFVTGADVTSSATEWGV